MKLFTSTTMVMFVLLSTCFANASGLNPRQVNEAKNMVTFCGWCHGRTGLETIGNAPRLAGQNSAYLSAQLNRYLTEDRIDPSPSLMTNAVNGFSDPAIIPYVANYFSKQATRPSKCVNTDLAAKGKQIYFNGIPERKVMACAACHGDDAKGAGTIPSLASQSVLYIKTRLQNWKQDDGSYSKQMSKMAKELEYDEMNALAAFVSSI